MDDPRCTNCGACCEFAVVPPFETEEIKSIDSLLAAPILLVWAHAADPKSGFWDQTKSRACSWLDPETKRCRHYDIRPQECRKFEVYSSECHELRGRVFGEETTQLTISAKPKE